jgi:hypothetical protein
LLRKQIDQDIAKQRKNGTEIKDDQNFIADAAGHASLRNGDWEKRT